MKSELVTATHQARKAVIYIRQSTPQQVVSHQESLRLQYDLKERALAWGWPAERIETIDRDLGQTGGTTVHREGFKELLAQVTLGEVGLILSTEVTRLSRNCSDWFPLLDVCAYQGCLIADGDGVYDPASANGRLLLGLKGQISEMELHTIQLRLRAGLLNKARRGDLALRLPAGACLGQEELCYRASSIAVPVGPPHVQESYIGICWRVLPISTTDGI
jgi:DNA invertase Pin-like site-specific DNA recombinase